MSKNADTAGQKENTAPGVPVEHPPLDSRSDTRVAGLSISKRLTGLVAFLGSLVAVVVPATEAIQSYIQGSWQMKIKERELNHQIAMEYLKLAISNDTKPADRQRVLRLLALFVDTPLSSWAGSELAEAQKQSDIHAKQADQMAKTIQDGQINIAKLNSDIYIIQGQMDEANSHQDTDRYWTLMTNLESLLLARRDQQAKLQIVVAQEKTIVTSAGGELQPKNDLQQEVNVLSKVDVSFVKTIFPDSSEEDISKYLPAFKNALSESGIVDAQLVSYTFAIIKVDSGIFRPIAEIGDGSKYEGRADLGNTQQGDGKKYIGRGFIQITGRANYQRMSQILGLGDTLLDSPEKALDPVIAARIGALFIKSKEVAIRARLNAGDPGGAERVVEGGYYHLDSFLQTYRMALERLTAK